MNTPVQIIIVGVPETLDIASNKRVNRPQPAQHSPIKLLAAESSRPYHLVGYLGGVGHRKKNNWASAMSTHDFAELPIKITLAPAAGKVDAPALVKHLEPVFTQLWLK